MRREGGCRCGRGEEGGEERRGGGSVERDRECKRWRGGRGGV